MKQYNRQEIDSGQFTELFVKVPNSEVEEFVEFASGFKGGKWKVDQLNVGDYDDGAVEVGRGNFYNMSGGCAFLVRPSGRNTVLLRYTPDTSGAEHRFYKGRGTLDSPAVANSGDSVGLLRWYGVDAGISVREVARIQARVDTATGSNDISGILDFLTRDDGSGATITTRMQLLKTGELYLTRGLMFPASAYDNADVNTLDDYEEGTFVPTFLTTGTQFTSVGYSATKYGRYTKIGNRVFFTIDLLTNALTVGSASGNLRLGSLPFVSGGPSYQGVGVQYRSGFTTHFPTGALVVSGTSEIALYYGTSTAADAVVPYTDLTNATRIIVFGHYMI